MGIKQRTLLLPLAMVLIAWSGMTWASRHPFIAIALAIPGIILHIILADNGTDNK